MSLRKKIIFSFFISAFIIAILAAFEYVTFIRVRNEMRSLEVTDTIRSESLQLRRHEKNYFLYPDKEEEEVEAIYNYLIQLEDIADSLQPTASADIKRLVSEYQRRFVVVESLLENISIEFGRMKETKLAPYSRFSPLIEGSFRDRPNFAAVFLMDILSLPERHPLVASLRELDAEIIQLRKTGENLIDASKKLDREARESAEGGIRISQTAILVVFPVFLIFGLGTLMYISGGVVKRLRTLTDSLERIGERYTSVHELPPSDRVGMDEVDALVEKFKIMGKQLEWWEDELHEKNKELLQSKKLAAIGTLASGVAHELNNPLNNIGISAQVLQRQLGEDASTDVRQIVGDIVGQTARVKGIVGDLLEFAREREPQLRVIELNSLVRGAYELVGTSMDTSKIRFVLDTGGETVTLRADHGQIERVFVNLFTNAVAAMDGEGELIVKVQPQDGEIKIWVSDSGKGMSEEDREKVFDPFFTRKEKGTGLGLAIVLNTIRKHGGIISVVSEEGVGTAFEIILPRGTV